LSNILTSQCASGAWGYGKNQGEAPYRGVWDMRLALMAGDTVPAGELKSLGFEAVQMFFGGGSGC